MSFRTLVIPNTCHSEYLSFRTLVIPNTCHSKHLSFRTLIILNTCHSEHLSFLTLTLPLLLGSKAGASVGCHWLPKRAFIQYEYIEGFLKQRISDRLLKNSKFLEEKYFEVYQFLHDRLNQFPSKRCSKYLYDREF